MNDSTPARPIAQVELAFADLDALKHLDDSVAKDLSAVARAGDCLFLACDESAGLERLVRGPDGRFAGHSHLRLGDHFDLPAGPEAEMDIEGLAVVDGWLWITGSHALKRRKPGKEDGEGVKALARMEEVEREANRFFLGRVPLEEEPASPGRFAVATAGERKPASLRTGPRAALAHWLRHDPHLAPFLAIPAKENGLDVEGLAVHGERVWLGLRGPVLGGHAVVIELELEESRPGRLKPRRIGPEGQRYRKHLLDTAGLGIRDLRRHGDDLFLLIGPTMALEGTAHVVCWQGAVADRQEGLVPTSRIRRLADLPYGRETDHPEGLELWPDAGPDAFLVVYDAPGPERLDKTSRTVRADVFNAA